MLKYIVLVILSFVVSMLIINDPSYVKEPEIPNPYTYNQSIWNPPHRNITENNNDEEECLAFFLGEKDCITEGDCKLPLKIPETNCKEKYSEQYLNFDHSCNFDIEPMVKDIKSETCGWVRDFYILTSEKWDKIAVMHVYPPDSNITLTIKNTTDMTAGKYIESLQEEGKRIDCKRDSKHTNTLYTCPNLFRPKSGSIEVITKIDKAMVTLFVTDTRYLDEVLELVDSFKSSY